MKPAEVRKLSTDDLVSESSRIRREIFDLRTKSSVEKIADNSRIGKARRDLARVLTERASRRAASEKKS